MKAKVCPGVLVVAGIYMYAMPKDPLYFLSVPCELELCYLNLV